MKFFDCKNKDTLEKFAYSNLSKVSKNCQIDYDKLKHNLTRKKNKEGNPLKSFETNIWLIERRYIF